MEVISKACHSWFSKPFAAMVSTPFTPPTVKLKCGFRSRFPRIHAGDQAFSAEVTLVEDLAVQLARQAGAVILKNVGRQLKVDAKSSRSDLVTEVDKACEELIRSGVKAAFPDHLWLGEETATTAHLESFNAGPSFSSWTWIVDPIDGTLNFIGGIRFCSVSIAVARGKSTEIGVIYNPFLDECFQARKGEGAFLNGKKISAVRGDTKLEDAIVTLGFTTKVSDLQTRFIFNLSISGHYDIPVSTPLYAEMKFGDVDQPKNGLGACVHLHLDIISFAWSYLYYHANLFLIRRHMQPEGRKAMLEAISKVGPHCRTVRALGSASLHICYVAAGRLGCFFELDLKAWDIAAARLVLEEAGGLVSTMDGKPLPLGGGSILATNGGQIHDQIVQLLL